MTDVTKKIRAKLGKGSIDGWKVKAAAQREDTGQSDVVMVHEKTKEERTLSSDPRVLEPGIDLRESYKRALA